MSTPSTPPAAPATQQTAADALSQRLAGKYMSFKLGAEEYGIEILKVRELIGLMPATRIPGTPSFIRGVINLRGRVIPVLELRLKLGMPAAETTDQAVIIVVEHRHGDATCLMGVLVDEVVEVINFAASQIEAAPDFGAPSEASAATMALGKLDARVICLLDIGSVLAPSEREALAVLQPA